MHAHSGAELRRNIIELSPSSMALSTGVASAIEPLRPAEPPVSGDDGLGPRTTGPPRRPRAGGTHVWPCLSTGGKMLPATGTGPVERGKLDERRAVVSKHGSTTRNACPEARMVAIRANGTPGISFLPFWQPAPAAEARACQNARHERLRFPGQFRDFARDRAIGTAIAVMSPVVNRY